MSEAEINALIPKINR